MKPTLTCLSRTGLMLIALMAGWASVSTWAAAAEKGAGCSDWNTVKFFKTASVEVVTACLKAGADPKARDEKGQIPLHLAAAYTDHPGVIVALIRAGADLRAVGSYGSTPLHSAAARPQLTTIPTLAPPCWRPVLTRGVGAFGHSGLTPLETAAEFNTNPDVLATLIQAGADPNSKAKRGLTPLHLAARRNPNPAIITALVKAGADPNARGGSFPSRQTPLFQAIEWGAHPTIITALVKAGADPNARTGTFRVGKTPLSSAIKLNAHPDIIDTLIKAGGDPKKRDWSPLLNPLTLSTAIPIIVLYAVN